MPTTAPLLPPLPAQNVPLVDPETGVVNRDWYRFFSILVIVLRQVRSEIP